jgi:phosphorylated adapter RNA export protein
MTSEAAQPAEKALLKHIAETLQEGNILLIKKVIDVIGPERTQEFLQKSLEIEAAGGLMTTDSSRRRTAGGVFFYTVRGSLPREEKRRIWPQVRKKKQRKGTEDSTSATLGNSTEPGV